MTKIFITGASGYIGGQVLHSLSTAHPEYSIRALVRNAAHGESILKTYKNAEVVSGSLDDLEIIEREATAADVILNLASTSHIKSAQAIHMALVRRADRSAHWIQISGATLLAAAELADKSLVPGEPSDTVFDDLDGLEAIKDIVRRYPSRIVDNYVLFTASWTPNLNTALVVPPIIYGEGQGPVNRRSVQVPSLVKTTLERKRGLKLGRGLSIWGNVHVQDLGDLFLKLVEKAVSRDPDESLWNANGVYLTGVDELPFEDISRRVVAAAAAKGLLETKDLDTLSAEEAESLLPHAVALFGTNARSKARRAKELLGWSPSHVSLEGDIPRTVEEESKTLSRL